MAVLVADGPGQTPTLVDSLLHSCLLASICISRTTMGSMCSKSASLLGGRTVHDDPDEGNTPNGSRQTDPRAAAAEAAERRRKAVRSLHQLPGTSVTESSGAIPRHAGL